MTYSIDDFELSLINEFEVNDLFIIKDLEISEYEKFINNYLYFNT